VMDVPIKYGRKSFTKASQKTIRKDRQQRGSKMIEADQLRKMLDAASQPLRAMALLGINAALGQSDIAELPIDAIDFKTGWLDFARVKTAVPRRILLWPETMQAIRDWLPDRPAPKDAADAKLLFITKYGQRWVRTKDRQPKPDGKPGGIVSIDAVSLEFGKLLRQLQITTPGNFYNLRRCYRTVCGELPDVPAINATMGHVAPSDDMGARYVQRIGDDRLRAVSNHVRQWLWPKAQEATQATLTPHKAPNTI
jgi:integrase